MRNKQRILAGGAARRWSCASAVIFVVALLSAAPGEPGKEPATQPAAAVAERVLEELRAAGAARAELLQAEQDWALEKERLALLKSAVEGEAARLAAAAAEARKEEVELNNRSSAVRAGRRRLEEVEAMVGSLADQLAKALDGLAGRRLPGLVPAGRAGGVADPAGRLAAAADRLSQAEKQAQAAGVELVDGVLAGAQLTVKLLRAGGVAGWWMSLDGRQAGQAAMKDGKLLLTPVALPADAEAIRKAFAIAEGHSAPAWSLLPAGHVRIAPASGGKP